MRAVRTEQAELDRARAVMGLDKRAPKRPVTHLSTQTDTGEQGLLSSLCREAGLGSAHAKTLRRRVALPLIGGVIGYGATGAPIFMLLAGIVMGAALVPVYRLRRRRIEKFDRDFAAFLLSLASSVRTGLDPLSALMLSARTFSSDSQIRYEIGEVERALTAGDSEERAIHAFGADVAHPDIPLFTTALILSRREGASLGESLQRLARVTRQRQSFRRKVQTALAMQKLSAFGIALSAIALTLIQGATNPQAVSIAINHPIGSKALYVGVLFMGLGLLWMLRMTKTRM